MRLNMKHVIMFKGGVETLEFFSVEISRYAEKTKKADA